MNAKITPAQTQLFKLALKASESINKAISVQLDAMKGWLREHYGEARPTYDEFWSDRAALKQLAAEKGLADDQWVRKPYNMAIKELYGDLPISMHVAAVTKRAQRPEPKARAAAVPKPSGNKVIRVQMPPDAESAVRQMLEHYGMAQVLLAFSTVLAEHRETKLEADRLQNLGDRIMSAAPPAQPQRSAAH